MAETSPFEAEEDIQNTIEEEILTVLLLAFISSGKLLKGDFFDFSLVNDSNSDLTKELSSIIPTLTSQGSRAIRTGLERAVRETDLQDLSYNFNSQRFKDALSEVFNNNLAYITDTNERMVRRVLEIANERGWSDQEILRRLRLYWGLTPDHVNTVLKLEEALAREGASRTVLKTTVQKKIDQLLEWRSSLISAQVASEVTENSKAVAFAEMFEDGDVSGDYVKQAVAVLDSNTTQICTSSHMTIAELNGNFPNGFFSPPFNNPVHPCRTSIRIIRRPES